MGFSMKKFLGPRQENLPFKESENRLFIQLQANRKMALAEIIPEGLMIQFLTNIFPDGQLRAITNAVYNTKSIDGESLRRIYLEDILRSTLSINRFGRKLILHHQVDPEDIVKIMLRDIDI